MKTTRSRRLARWAMAGAIVLGYLFMLAPTSVVLIEAFNAGDLVKFPPTHFSFRWFVALAQNSEFTESFVISLKLGLLAAVASTILGTLAAYGLRRYWIRHTGLETLLLAPLYVPRVLIGMALLLALSRIYLSGSFAGMLIGHILVTLPFVVRAVAVSIHGVDPAIEEAARSLGATNAQMLLRVVLPLIRSGIAAGGIFAFVISFSDVYLALFIAGADVITLPLRIFNFLQWDDSPIVAAASAAQIILILAVVLIAEKAVGLSSVNRS
jgi:putative spermidine/putrescine transport system permease protein